MTIEIQAEALCDHKVHREPFTMDWYNDRDYRTIRLTYPIANDAVRMWCNDREIPRDDPDFGWTLVRDERSAEEDPAHKIILKRPIVMENAIFEVSYTVRSDLCRKCFGNLILYDHMFDRAGSIILCAFEQKLMQQIIKILFTQVGSNPFIGWYGTEIPEAVYKGIRDPSGLKRRMVTDVTLALDKLRNVHYHQAKVQYLQPREIIDKVRNVDVMQDANDPRVFYIVVECSTLAGDNLLIKREMFLGEIFNTLPVREAGIV